MAEVRNLKVLQNSSVIIVLEFRGRIAPMKNNLATLIFGPVMTS